MFDDSSKCIDDNDKESLCLLTIKYISFQKEN